MTRPRLATVAATLLLALFAGTLPACQTVLPGYGAATVRSAGELPAGRFDTAVYRHDGEHRLTAVLLRGEPDQPRQAMIIRMFWRPSASGLPRDREATNASIRYVVFGPGKDASVYSGAGFVMPAGRSGKSRIRAELRQAVLEMTDRSEGETALPLQAHMTATFSAELDEAAVGRLLRRLDAAVTDRLGYPRLVRHEPGTETPGRF
ncbi:MAG: hypothetical protein ACLFVN_01530 [Phycisphaeraceae bacterium]